MIAFLIISIAWINYTNLATARSLERAKEVGLRKVLGAIRGDLILQFLTESFLMNTLALLLAIGLAWLLAPSFDTLIGTNAGAFSLPPDYLLGFLGIFILGSFLSGIYPAFVLSGYHPITVLKGLFRNSTSGQFLRKGLIVGQFAVSVILITGTILVYQQVQYMRRQQLGVDIDRTLVVEGASSLQDSTYQNVFQPFKTTLLQQPDIKSVTSSSNVMGQEIYWTRIGRPRRWIGKAPRFPLPPRASTMISYPPTDLHPGRKELFPASSPPTKRQPSSTRTPAISYGFKTPADALAQELLPVTTPSISSA